MLIGFGGLLLIMALAGIDALGVFQQFRRSDEQIRGRYLSQNHVLNDIRSDVYLSGTYVRDYFLEADPARAEVYRTSLENVRKHMEAALEFYGRQTSPAEAQHYSALRTELMDYWGLLAPIFRWDPTERRRTGYTFLRDQVSPGGRTCWHVREKRFTEAANAFDQALTILERTRGPDNPELVPTMEHYSRLPRAEQDFAAPRAGKHAS